MADNRNRSCQITTEGIKLIEKIRMERGWNKSQLQEYLIDKTKIESIARILRIKRGEKNTIDLIATALDISPTDLVHEKEWFGLPESSETKASVVNWRSVSKRMLEDLKRLTTEALTAGDGIRFDFDDVFVPLGVVERQQKTKRKEDDGAPDRGSELYEEKVTPITHDEFFKDVLLRGNTKISNGKRIAVIGEAGAGKTTQLQKIGSWLLEKSDDIPVWISLTDLGAKSLREYLFENWVREASGEIEAAPQVWKDSLGDAIKSGKVWLLLDGVDEMTVSNPLSYLSTQLKESWLKNVRVVLTCRVNVWDGGKNALTGFDVYRNLDFDYPDDVYKFIGKWFAGAPELAGSLTQALEQSGKERIRDMVKNPLRLTLLCFSWQKLQGGLPETKAGLYEWFVNTFYDWKREEVEKVTGVEINSSKIKELNKALGELAKLAIDSESSRFRLTETFIRNNMNPDLFDLADKLNWLNKVGDAAENPLEKVYAFYHPSFQEYFAALAIDDWDFFVPCNHIDKPVKDVDGNYKHYRIFESIWREVIILWVGKTDIAREQRKKFFEVLFNFRSNCVKNYSLQAQFLCVILMSECNEFVYSIDSLSELLTLLFKPSDFKLDANNKLFTLVDNITKEEIPLLQSIKSKYVITSLESLLDAETNIDIQDEIALFIIELDSTNQKAIEVLRRIILSKNLFGDLHIYWIAEIMISKKINCPEAHDFIIKLQLDAEPMVKELASKLNILSQKMRGVYSIDYLENINYEFKKVVIPSKVKDFNDFVIQFYQTYDKKQSNAFYISHQSVIETSIVTEILKIGTGNIEVISIIINLILIGINTIYSQYYLNIFLCKSLNREKDCEYYVDVLKKIITKNIIVETIGLVKRKMIILSSFMKEVEDKKQLSKYYRSYQNLWDILIFCSRDLNYPSFYDAWHQSSNEIDKLESQLIDCEEIQKELDRNTEIRCLFVDIRHLEQESDTNVIAEEIAIKIFDSLGREIPEVNRVSNLKRELLNLKRILGIEKLAIALYGKSANEAINQLCHNLAPSIQTRLFTGGQTTQELITQINAWRSEM